MFRVQFRAGLSSEIIINIIILTATALLFSGFLLTKLLERELLAQRLRNVTGIMEILAGTVSQGGGFEGVSGDEPLADIALLFQKISSYSSLEAWAVVDSHTKPLAVFGDENDFHIDWSALTKVKYSDGSVVKMIYDAPWQPFKRDSDSYILITVPVEKGGNKVGAIQARFALTEVHNQIASARKLIFYYAMLYGGILVLFGVYALKRAVLRPVRRLQKMAQLIAAGDLEQTVPLEGPAEIVDLARSFNSMTAVLQQGQVEREAHIAALEQANAEVRKAQDDLVRSEKVATVGHLAAGMAHELGNPLGAIVGYLGILRDDLSPRREKEIVERALDETVRIDRLVRELLDYASPSDDRLELFDPVGAMAEARDILMRQKLFDEVNLDDRLPSELPLVRMTRHKLVQVFINLLLNARDALTTGGTIRLSACAKGSQLWLSVADTGAGMGDNVISQIFEPFYSTKDPGKGRGLGLAVCQRIVSESGGHIEVASSPGEGSEFRVCLPNAG